MKIRRLVSLMMALILAIALAVPASAAELTYDVPGGKLYFDASTGTITRSDTTITQAVIPEQIYGVTVTAIDDHAFRQHHDLSRVVIPDTVTSIGQSAFYGCSSLTSIEIPNSVTTVGQSAFENCANLSSVTIGQGMTAIPRNMFSNAASLTSVTITENITSIGYDAFAGTGLTSVTLPSSVTAIGGSAFSNCRSLRSVYIPDSVTQIGESAFEYCTILTDVRLSSALTTISRAVFQSCVSLDAITIPNGVTTLENSVFYACSNLGAITIPASVTAIGNSTFYGCDRLTDVYYGSDAAHWSQVQVGGLNEGLDQATIHFAEPVAGFSDVTTGDYYADAVQWAVNHGVTGGTSATTFSPAAAVTRGQAVTFLWRAAGSPEPSSTVSPFTDVSSADYYYKPVLWASEQGITGGIGNNQFGPNVNLAYDQIFTMLRAAAGQSAASSDWSAAAVSWAQESGLTDGLSFSAKADCPRSDVIYCLWKQMA